jgi:hypothetical protein
MLSFTFNKSITDADFLIEEHNPKNWNDAGFFIRYRISALPHITGGKTIPLGGLLLMSLEYQQKESNAAERIMSDQPVFVSLKDGFFSRLTSEIGAQRLFYLLSPEQRKEFCSALRLCVDLEQCKQVSKNTVYYRTLFRRVYDNRFREDKSGDYYTHIINQESSKWDEFNQDSLLPIRKYLCSELSMDDLHQINDLESDL